MCGICGIIDSNLGGDRLGRAVRQMVDVLEHRGPDGQGVVVRPGLAFGHRRLSIIDLEGGSQPWVDPRGFVLTYNGELYNFRQLRRQLEKSGEKFDTDCDTEVVLKAYIHWGIDCLDKFNGMFAFAIHDMNTHEVLLARDRIGIKPLYYCAVHETLIFASEIKAILAGGLVDPDIDLSLVPFYLDTGYFPREHTPFRNFKMLEPGHFLRWKDGRADIRCYWNIAEIVQANGVHRAGPEDREELEHLISDAVSLQTVSDVPIGTFLSGGLDSGIVTAMLARSGLKPIRTFTAAIRDEASMDESLLARKVAQRFDTNHSEIQITHKDMLNLWEDLFEHFDLPFADLSAIPTFLISKFASSQVKVVLSGDGGDEQWGGYTTYFRYLQIASFRQRLRPLALRRLLKRGATLLASTLRPVDKITANRLQHYGSLLCSAPHFLYRDMLSQLGPRNSKSLFGERVVTSLGEDSLDIFHVRNPELGLDGLMMHDLRNFMVDDVLRKVDMMSMRTSLEVRVPLLDHRIVEKSMCLSWRDKILGSRTKTMIREIFREVLPEGVINGVKKGFGVPSNTWFRGPLCEMAHDFLFSQASKERGVLSPSAISRIWQDHQECKSDHGKLIANILILEKWLQKYD